MTNEVSKDITATHSMGGIAEFIKTGIYPDYLIISSSRLKKSWRIRVKNKPQKGVLKMQGSIVLKYTFKGFELKIREVNKNSSGNDWIKIDVEDIMCD